MSLAAMPVVGRASGGAKENSSFIARRLATVLSMSLGMFCMMRADISISDGLNFRPVSGLTGTDGSVNSGDSVLLSLATLRAPSTAAWLALLTVEPPSPPTIAAMMSPAGPRYSLTGSGMYSWYACWTTPPPPPASTSPISVLLALTA